MLCYFLREGHIAGVEILPPGLSDEDAIARVHRLSLKRKGPFDGFEVSDHARFVWLPSAMTLPAVLLRTGCIVRNRGHVSYSRANASAMIGHRSKDFHNCRVRQPCPQFTPRHLG
jgi:hypothetical protein